MTIDITYLHCKRCGHKWTPRTAQPPQKCPNQECQSYNWDKPRKKSGGSVPVELPKKKRGPSVD